MYQLFLFLQYEPKLIRFIIESNKKRGEKNKRENLLLQNSLNIYTHIRCKVLLYIYIYIYSSSSSFSLNFLLALLEIYIHTYACEYFLCHVKKANKSIEFVNCDHYQYNIRGQVLLYIELKTTYKAFFCLAYMGSRNYGNVNTIVSNDVLL